MKPPHSTLLIGSVWRPRKLFQSHSCGSQVNRKGKDVCGASRHGRPQKRTPVEDADRSILCSDIV
eukprot:scaffold114644_cov30-Phaeocystis_antarctica.AAC.2